jgi:hypothetical protein
VSSSCIIYDVAHYLVLGVRVRLQAYEEAPGQAAQHKLPHPPRGPVSCRVTRTTQVQTRVQLDRWGGVNVASSPSDSAPAVAATSTAAAASTRTAATVAASTSAAAAATTLHLQ